MLFGRKKRPPLSGGAPWATATQAGDPRIAGAGAPGLRDLSPPEAKPGLGTRLLGEGWEDKAFALGGLIAGDGGRAVAMYHQARKNDAMAQKEAAAKQAEELRKRSLDRQDFVFEHDYKRQNPAAQTPTAMQRDYEWLAQNHPDLAGQYLNNKVTAPPMVVTNPDGTRTIYPAGSVPRGGGQQMPTFTQDDWDKAQGAGGPTQPASGGFRR